MCTICKEVITTKKDIKPDSELDSMIAYTFGRANNWNKKEQIIDCEPMKKASFSR